MNNEAIKIAEDTIKHLKDFIEVERCLKKIITSKARNDLYELAVELIKMSKENINELQGE